MTYKYETLLVDITEGVGIITLNRPEKLNALSTALNNELEDVLTRFETDDDVKVVIITGAGEKAFSAGGDISETWERSNTTYNERRVENIYGTFHRATYPKPLIGALNGLAYGGAASLTTMCDIRVGCERTSFRFVAAKMGRIMSTWTLPLIVGWPMTKELLFTGRVVKAEEAYKIGLLNHLVPSSF